MMVEAQKIKPGQHVRRSNGEVVKVLNSNPTGGAATTWELCGYAEGQPTWRFVGDPNFEFEVVEP